MAMAINSTSRLICLRPPHRAPVLRMYLMRRPSAEETYEYPCSVQRDCRIIGPRELLPFAAQHMFAAHVCPAFSRWSNPTRRISILSSIWVSMSAAASALTATTATASRPGNLSSRCNDSIVDSSGHAWQLVNIWFRIILRTPQA